MTKGDFTRTSIQVQRDITDLLDGIDRSLDSSNGESERKGHFVLSAFLSVLAVFASILGIEHFVGSTSDAEVKSDEGTAVIKKEMSLNQRDLKLIGQHLDRMYDQSRFIRETKNKIAPAMPVDGSLDAIDNSVLDIRSLVGIPDKTSKGS